MFILNYKTYEMSFQLIDQIDNGVNQVNIPGFFYADDGLRLYNTIHDYVDEYVHHYYSGINDEGKLLLTGTIIILTFIT